MFIAVVVVFFCRNVLIVVICFVFLLWVLFELCCFCFCLKKTFIQKENPLFKTFFQYICTAHHFKKIITCCSRQVPSTSPQCKHDKCEDRVCGCVGVGSVYITGAQPSRALNSAPWAPVTCKHACFESVWFCCFCCFLLLATGAVVNCWGRRN